MKNQYKAGLKLAYNDLHFQEYLDSPDSDSQNRALGPCVLVVLMMKVNTMRRMRRMRRMKMNSMAVKAV